MPLDTLFDIKHNIMPSSWHPPDDELVKQFLKTQQLSPVRNDWCNTILNDLNFLEINLEEKEIAQMKKNKFKALVIEKIRHASNSFLYDQVQKHSKSTKLKASSGIQKYLTSQILTIKEKQVLFSLRTRTFNCKANFFLSNVTFVMRLINKSISYTAI